MITSPWHVVEGDSPLIATAIHAGHTLRPEVEQSMRLTPLERLREEDPFTDAFTCVAPTRIVVDRSRFEVDLNRPPEKAVYLDSADCWGLDVWKCQPTRQVVEESRELHRQFFEMMATLIQHRINRFGFAVILDIHSYNHRRDGANRQPATELDNPQVNIGTGSLPAYRWDTLLQAFLGGFRVANYRQGLLDVRENVRFKGGYFPQWVHATFPEQACAIAIEFKKTFMDEWTGQLDCEAIDQLGSALETATLGLEQEYLRRHLANIPPPTEMSPENSSGEQQ